MLTNTFCHLPGVGLKTERNLWKKGVLTWDDARAANIDPVPGGRYFFKSRLNESFHHLETGNARFFSDALPGKLHWRMFPEFRDATAYLDIETSGNGANGEFITTIALYDGTAVHTYVRGRNLSDFLFDVRRYRVLVTYNGRCFDVPVIERVFGLKLDQGQIDLRFVLNGLGYRGGLKSCEKQLGLDREELDGVDGYYAVLLWDEYARTGNERVLETLLAYSAMDAANLEILMVTAYNLSVEDTPFRNERTLPVPEPVRVPFEADVRVLDNVRRRIRYG